MVAEPLTKLLSVIVPAVGVIVGDDDDGAGPERGLFDGVDCVDDEGLLVEGIGVARVTVLVSRGLEKANGRHVAGGESIGEVVYIVLVLGLIRGSDRARWDAGGSGSRCWRSTGRADDAGCSPQLQGVRGC